MKLLAFSTVIATALTVTRSDGFDPESQRIDVTADHKYYAPSNRYYRGPCPGLNALANHGFIPRNGIASADEIINASTSVFGMSLEQASVATYYSIPFTVSPDLDHISIGAPLNGEISNDSSVSLRMKPQGLNFPHNGLEHDASATRLNKNESGSQGNNHDLSLPLFKQLLDRQANISDDKVDFNIKILADHRLQRLKDSVEHDPLFFLQPLSGFWLNGYKYASISRLFANHSAEYPTGRLDRRTLMSFFGVEEEAHNQTHTTLRYKRGSERIPDIWYRRPLDSPYTFKQTNDDLLEMARYHPELIEQYGMGGNTKGVNSYQTVAVTNLTNELYAADNLKNGYNLSCFAFSAGPQLAPFWLAGYYVDWEESVGPRLLQKLPELVKELGCPSLNMTIDGSRFDGFPGLILSLPATPRG